jgi:spermidine synthase
MSGRGYSLFVVVLMLLLLDCRSSWADYKTVLTTDSAYSAIRILDKDDGLRHMLFGGYTQTVMRLGDPDYLYYAYVRSVMAGFAFLQKPAKNILTLGLGGGSEQQFIAGRFKDVTIDIFEIDPVVVDLAQKYFNFSPGTHGHVSIGDARRLLRKSNKKYDLIILDAYKAGAIPFHLTTREFVELVKQHVSPGGVAAFHLWEEKVNKYLQNQIKTIADVFPRTYIFNTGEGSYIIFAARQSKWLSKEEVVARGKKIAVERVFPFDLEKLITEQYGPASRIVADELEGQILTDDFAPVNLLRHKSVQ